MAYHSMREKQAHSCTSTLLAAKAMCRMNEEVLIIFVSSSADGFYTKLYMNLMFCVMYCGLMRQQSQEQ
jgi:hypothetical protein